MRKLEFQTGEYYHIYNRGVDKRDIFIDKWDYIRFLQSMREFNQAEPVGSLYVQQELKRKEKLKNKAPGTFKRLPEPKRKLLVNVICYSLLSNHFHFMLKQVTDKGISKFMHKVSMGYTNYFNFKNNRSGYLFQGRYRAIHIKSDGHLFQLSGYINGNAEIHKITKAENWPWSSYLDYVGLRQGTLCKKQEILNEFKNINEYKNLIKIIIKESKQGKEEMKKYLLE